MCTVSAVTGALQNYTINSNWSAESWANIKKILSLCEKIDAQLGEPDCIDPAKEEWLKEMSDLWDRANVS